MSSASPGPVRPAPPPSLPRSGERGPAGRHGCRRCTVTPSRRLPLPPPHPRPVARRLPRLRRRRCAAPRRGRTRSALLGPRGGGAAAAPGPFGPKAAEGRLRPRPRRCGERGMGDGVHTGGPGRAERSWWQCTPLASPVLRQTLTLPLTSLSPTTLPHPPCTCTCAALPRRPPSAPR